MTCCSLDSDCVSADPCMTGQCQDSTCTFENTCCTSEFDCKDNDPCTQDICEDDGTCSHPQKQIFGCCDAKPYVEDFENNSVPMEFENSDTNVGWHIVSNQKSTSGNKALYYGDPDTLKFDTGGINSGVAKSSAFSLSPGVGYRLKAQLYMDTDYWGNTDVVTFELQLSGAPNSNDPIVVWKSSSSFPSDEFAPVDANISAFAGQTVNLLIRFDTVDSWFNNYEGVYVDEILIESECTQEICSAKSECKDTISESTEDCIAGVCSYELNP